jgi:hypothetical protein
VVGTAGTEDLSRCYSPSYLGPRQDRWRALLAGCSKTKNSNILVLNQLGAEVFASRRMKYRLLRNKTQEFAYLFGTFLVFFGNNRRRKLCLLASGTLPRRRACRITVFILFAMVRFSSRVQPHIQGGVFWNFCPASEPICFATRNSQSRFSAIPSGTSGVEDGAYARLHGCTEWLADGMSRALPTHPHVHIAVDTLSIGSSGWSLHCSSKLKNAEDNSRRHHGHSKRTT